MSNKENIRRWKHEEIRRKNRLILITVAISILLALWIESVE